MSPWSSCSWPIQTFTKLQRVTEAAKVAAEDFCQCGRWVWYGRRDIEFLGRENGIILLEVATNINVFDYNFINVLHSCIGFSPNGLTIISTYN